MYNYTIINMEKIYIKNQKACQLKKACPETIRFLMDFSRSLQIVEFGNLKFENNLN